MIITELPENETEGANIQVRTQKVPEFQPSSSVTRAFWGVKVSPQEPVTISFRNRPHKLLRISQATLGELCLDNMEKSRSVLSSKIGDNPEVLICSLRLKRREMTRLSLDFEGPCDVVFSVKGPWEIHLVGYLFDHTSATTEIIPPQIFGNEREYVASKNEGGCCSFGIEGGSIASKNQLSASNKGDKCKHSKEAASKLNIVSHYSQQNIPTLSYLHVADVKDGVNKIIKEGGISILVQGLIETQIEAVGECKAEQLQGTNSVRTKLDYLIVNEVEPRVEQVATHGTTQITVHNEESGVSKHGVERSTKHGSPDCHVLQSRKNKRLNKRKKHDEEQDDHIRSIEHVSCQNLELGSKEDKKLKKKKKKKLNKQKQAEDDNNRAANDGLHTPAFDSEEVDESRKYMIEDDSIRSHDLSEDFALDTKQAKKARKQKKKVVQEEIRVLNDGLPTSASDSGEAEKSNKNTFEDDSIRYAQHDIPEDATLDTRKAKKAGKQEKKVVQEEARSQEAQRVPLVCALPCFSKR